ncbi:hypothetical protein BDW74DRAFT_179806 [Aspergillus multicolor]|uniref:uncharacterized protein n=1 Tax=Aspergillus multicolor TaxID=41759 RepID=UPI003CCDE81E
MSDDDYQVTPAETAEEGELWDSDATDEACTEAGGTAPDGSSLFQADEIPNVPQAERVGTKASDPGLFSPYQPIEVPHVDEADTEASNADAGKASAGASYTDVLKEHIRHVIDPEGEVMLLLKDGDRLFAVWDQEDEPVVWSDYLFEATPPKPAAPRDRSETVSYRVSEKHLMFASPVFRSMLENHGSQERAKVIVVRSFGSEALLICLNIIHGKVETVPRQWHSMIAEAAIQRTINFVHDKLNHRLSDGYWSLLHSSS